MIMKNIDKASERIKKAVINNEQIVVFADSDLDGAASAVILKETIDNLNYSKTVVLFPDRKNEGYGLNKDVLEIILSKFKKALLITLDCGITNYEEIKIAKKKGLDVIIVDHHKEIGGKLPEADIIVDPKQKTDDCLFKEYANAGITYILAEEILGSNMPSMLKESFLELVALATISDMMIETEDNKEFIIRGLSTLEKSERPALKTMIKLLDRENFKSKRDMVAKINSALNSARINDHVMASYLLLIESNIEKAAIMAKDLLEESEAKHREINALTDEIKNMFLKSSLKIIFTGSPKWSIEYLGAVASRLCNNFDKPVFIYQKYEEISRGTVRVPKKYDAVKAMESCSKLLETFGGHAPAAGFTVKNENIGKFEQCLLEYFEK
jgi:single-stranded-DNA-specific exonuclease